MDPLSLTASFLAVIGAAKVGANGVRKLNRYRKAPSEINDLASELEDIQALLTDIESFTKSYPRALYNESLHECVRRAAPKIVAINDLLASTPFNLSRLSDDNHARALWVRYKPTLIAFRDDLQVIRMDLAVRIGLVKASSSCRVEESLMASACAQEKISDQLSTIIQNLMPDQEHHVSSNKVHVLASNNAVGSGHPTFGSSSAQVLGSGSAILGFPATTATRDEYETRSSLGLVENGASVLNKRCNFWCCCACHTSTSAKSPRVLEILIGSVKVHYNGRRPACNEFRCRRTPDSSFNMTYQLPGYLMSRYIAMKLRYNPLDGPQLSLRMPRVITWSHPLQIYAIKGDLLGIQKLFSDGKASPYDLNPRGSTVLIVAGAFCDLQLSQFLLQQGADPDLPNNIGQTASEGLWEQSFAGLYGTEGVSIVGSLLKDTDYIETRRFSTLHKIILGILHRDLKSELEISTAEINTGDSHNRTPLCWATIHNDLRAVKTLLAFGANPNLVDGNGHTPLHFVKSIDLCRLLLDAGVDIHARTKDWGRSALHSLFHSFSLRRLSTNHTVDLLDLLIEAGIDVNVRNTDCETPLLNALYSGLTSHARRLIELGADVNIANLSSQESTIHFAVIFDRYELIPLLLEKGADYTALNTRGQNIAHLAALTAKTKTISVLAISNLVNLDVSLRDRDRKTPADYLSERSILIESEQGLYEAFNELIESIPQRKPSDFKSKEDNSRGIFDATDIGLPSNTHSDHHLPGAYPSFVDSE